MHTPIAIEALAELYPFAQVGGERLQQLLALCHHERLGKSLDPFRQRDYSGQMIYLIKGELKVVQPDGTTRVLVGGTERALFPVSQAGQMPTSSKAITDVEFLRIEEEAADILVTWDQCIDQSAIPAASDWAQKSGMFAAQSLTHGVFSMLPSAHIGMLLERFHRESRKKGEVVIRQGEAGEYYYLIERGRCSVTRELAGTIMELAELSAGEAFGEDALISDMPRNATVTMRTDGVLLKLDKQDFNELLREPLMQRLSVAEAVQRVGRGAQWLDVRFSPEYQHDGLPGAMNVPLSELREATPLLDPERDYIVYCQTGRRSAAAVFLMSQRGLKAYLLDGGLRAFGGGDS